MKKHCFDVELAEKYGIEKAIILENLAFWISKNIHNEINLYDGNYYTYNSYSAFADQFPYIKERTIRKHINELEKLGLISSRNDLNKSKWDKTKWYSIESKEVLESLLRADEIKKIPKFSIGHNMSHGQNRKCRTDKTESVGSLYDTDINTDINTDTKSNNAEGVNATNVAEAYKGESEQNKGTNLFETSTPISKKIDYDLFKKAWNSLDDLTKLRAITDKRKKKIQARIKENPNFIKDFLEVVNIIPKCSFLLGANNRGWKIDFDWVIENGTNYIKVLEGKYLDEIKPINHAIQVNTFNTQMFG